MRLARLILLAMLPLLASASIPPLNFGLGFGAPGGSGGSLQITTASLSGAVVGSPWTPGTLTTSGQVGAVSCFQVSATPDDQQWMYLSPSGTPGGTPQNIEIDTVTYECVDAANSHTAQATFSFNTTASGSLAVVSTTSLSACPSGGFCAYQTLFSGGTPPYKVSATSTQPWYQTVDQWIEGTPTATGMVTLNAETVSDSVGHTTTYTPTVTVGSALTFSGIDPVAGIIRLPQGSVGAYYGVQLNWYGGTGVSDACSTTSALPSGITLSSGCLLSGKTTQVGAWAISVKITDSGGNTTSTAWLSIAGSGVVSRPGYNTSSAFFVLNGRLYDPNGVPFTMNGLDRNHFDSDSWASGTNGALTSANAVRMFLDTYDTPSDSVSMGIALAQHIDNGELPILTQSVVMSFMGTGSITGNTLTLTGTTYGSLAIGKTVWPLFSPGLPSGTTITGGSGTTWTLSGSATSPASGTFTASAVDTSGDTSTADLTSVVNWWVQMEPAFAPYMNEIAINIANEWGGAVGSPNSVATWATQYEAAISALRTAGYTCPLVIDMMSFGQDFTAYSAGNALTVLNSDSEKNIILSNHLYNSSNILGQISGITKGANAVITINSAAATNPFNVGTFNGQIYVSGVAGMTQINGQTIAVTAKGGSAGAWTITTNLDTSAYGTYTSSGTAYDSQNYQVRLSELSGYIAAGLPIIVGEFGPPGSNNTTAGLSQFISASKAWGVPELEWAWDNNNLGGGATSWLGSDVFGLTLAGPGTYVLDAPAGLTAPGEDVVLNPRSGLALSGQSATVFH